METTNPYAAPNADLSAGESEYDTSNAFSPKGRFGRLSYLAWSMSVTLVVGVVFSVLITSTALFAPGAEQAMFGANLIVQLVVFAVTVMFIIRRLHDINAAGWWALLMLVPIVNVFFGLFLLIKRGSEGSNRFGPYRPTPVWEQVVGYIGIGLLAISVLGVIAAILIPTFLAPA